MANIRKVSFKLEYAVTGAVLGILCCILFFRPLIGVADNGDFERIMNSTGLYYLTDNPSDRYFGFVNRLYGSGFIIPFGGGYLTTQLPLVLLSVFISRTFLGTALFDIRFLAAIYILIFSTAVFISIRSIRKSSGFSAMIAAVVLLFVFCDTGYTSYFNSLYGEPVTFVFLLLMAAIALMLALKDTPNIWVLVAFGISAILFAGAKVQNTPAGLMLVLFLIRLAGVRRELMWKRVAILAAASVTITSLICYASVSREIKVCNKYQTVFYGILKGSPNPAADLEELGLDPSYSVLAGTHYFLDDYLVDIKTPMFQKMIYEEVSHLKVAVFYLKHPDRLLQKLEYAAKCSFKVNQGVGNYEKYPEAQYKQETEVFNLWSRFKSNYLPHSLLFIAVFYGFIIIGLILQYKKTKNRSQRFLVEFAAIISLTGILQFILPVIGDGEADLSKHLFLFNLCFDLLVFAGATYAAVKAASLARYLRERHLMSRLQTE